MKRHLLCMLAALSFSLTGAAIAGTPHYINGTLGLNAAYYYTANTTKNNQGGAMPVAGCNLDAYVMLHSLASVFKFTILGGRWLADINIPIANIDFPLKQSIPLPFPLPSTGSNVVDFKREASSTPSRRKPISRMANTSILNGG